MSAHPKNSGHNSDHGEKRPPKSGVSSHGTGHLGNLELGKDQPNQPKKKKPVLKTPKPVPKKIKPRKKPLSTPKVITELQRRLKERARNR